MSDRKLTRIPAYDVPRLEGQLLPLVDRVVERSNGEINVSTVMRDIYFSHSTLWIDTNDMGEIVFFVTTRLITYPTGRLVMRFDCSAGTLGALDGILQDYLPELMEIARKLGAHAVRIEGRPGWQKVLPDWRRVLTVIEKELTDG